MSLESDVAGLYAGEDDSLFELATLHRTLI